MHPSSGQEEEFDGLRVEARRPVRDDKGLGQEPGRVLAGGQGTLEKQFDSYLTGNPGRHYLLLLPVARQTSPWDFN